MTSFTASGNTTQAHSRRLQFEEQGPDPHDILAVNITAHADRAWPVAWTWGQLLDRINTGSAMTADDVWDLDMIRKAAQSAWLNPVACHPGVEWIHDIPANTRLRGGLELFRRVCDELWTHRGDIRACALHLERLRRVLLAIDREMLRSS